MRRVLTSVIATYAGRVSSQPTMGPFGPTTLLRMLSYHVPASRDIRCFGTKLEPRYIFGAKFLI